MDDVPGIVEERTRSSVKRSRFVFYRDEHHVYSIPVVEACQGKPDGQEGGVVMSK